MLKVIFSFQRPHLFIKRKNHTIRSRGFLDFILVAFSYIIEVTR